MKTKEAFRAYCTTCNLILAAAIGAAWLAFGAHGALAKLARILDTLFPAVR
jgi:hypothetical protein